MSRASAIRKMQDAEAARVADAAARLTALGFEMGQRIKVDDEGSSTFTITGIGKDGSISCTDDATGTFRSFLPDWCYPAFRVNRRNRVVATKCPPEVKGRRAAWRAQRFAAIS